MGTSPFSIRSGKASMKPSSIVPPVDRNIPRTGSSVSAATVMAAVNPAHDQRRRHVDRAGIAGAPST